MPTVHAVLRRTSPYTERPLLIGVFEKAVHARGARRLYMQYAAGRVDTHAGQAHHTVDLAADVYVQPLPVQDVDTCPSTVWLVVSTSSGMGQVLVKVVAVYGSWEAAVASAATLNQNDDRGGYHNIVRRVVDGWSKEPFGLGDDVDPECAEGGACDKCGKVRWFEPKSSALRRVFSGCLWHWLPDLPIQYTRESGGPAIESEDPDDDFECRRADFKLARAFLPPSVAALVASGGMTGGGPRTFDGYKAALQQVLDTPGITTCHLRHPAVYNAFRVMKWVCPGCSLEDAAKIWALRVSVFDCADV